MVNPTQTPLEKSMFTLKSAVRIGSLAIAGLVLSTVVAEAAAGNYSKAREQCRTYAESNYDNTIVACRGGVLGATVLETTVCQARAAEGLQEDLEACDDPSIIVIPTSTSVGGPTSTGLDGWHPKGKKTKGLFDADALKGADTSGGHGGSSVDVGGGSNGGGGKALGGTFNSSMGSASMSTGGGSGGIIQ
jgi:hypothetical protein